MVASGREVLDVMLLHYDRLDNVRSFYVIRYQIFDVRAKAPYIMEV